MRSGYWRPRYAAVPMASGGDQPARPPGQRHSGVVHGGLNRRPATPPRRDWVLGGMVAGLTVIAMLIVANVFAAKPADVAAVPTDSPTPISVSSLPIFVQETPAPPSPTPTLAPTPTASSTPIPTPTPTLAPTPSATLPPTPTPMLVPTPAPSAPPTPAAPPSSPPLVASPPALGLVILQPADGATTSDHSVVISGLSQPGVTITHDIPNWFDEHTTADSQGRWSFTESLAEGQNTFKFRVADDMTTEVTLTIYYEPG